jgi:cellulose synthase/poly-beta-1,6-N-acetylglucosamine synthase-like glycosyltransferase
MRRAPLEDLVLQTYDGLSNETETWLTRLAGLLTRNRYEIALPLKARARLNCPLTGDGLVLGARVLERHPWRVATITEGWELYAGFTTSGVRVFYAPEARFYAQESRSLEQSGSQRQRWSSGRREVLRLYARKILLHPGVRPLQRLDLFTELMSLGPAVQGFLASVCLSLALSFRPPLATPISLCCCLALGQPVLYSAISLRRHPEPVATIIALFRLPFYVAWRVWVAIRAGFVGTAGWVRTQRVSPSSGSRRMK